MRHRGEPDGPAAVALLQRHVVAVDAAAAAGGDGGREHRLDHYFAGGHEVHRLIEIAPERAEMLRPLEHYHCVYGLVDLRTGHIALVDIFDVAARLQLHRNVHYADRSIVDQRRLALVDRVDEILPTGDLVAPANQVGTDAECVGVVDRWDHGEIFGRRGRQLLGIWPFPERRLHRRVTLRGGDPSVRELALGEHRHRLVPEL